MGLGRKGVNMYQKYLWHLRKIGSNFEVVDFDNHVHRFHTFYDAINYCKCLRVDLMYEGRLIQTALAGRNLKVNQSEKEATWSRQQEKVILDKETHCKKKENRGSSVAKYASEFLKSLENGDYDHFRITPCYQGLLENTSQQEQQP